MSLKIRKILNIHHVRVVKKFSYLNEVKISDIERYLSTYVSNPTARKIIHQLGDSDIIKFEHKTTDKRVKIVRFLKKNLDEFM